MLNTEHHLCLLGSSTHPKDAFLVNERMILNEFFNFPFLDVVDLCCERFTLTVANPQSES